MGGPTMDRSRWVQWLDVGVYWVGDARRLWRGWLAVALLGGVLLWWWAGSGAAPAAQGQPSAAEVAEPVALALPGVLSAGALSSAAVQLQEFPWGPEAQRPVVAVASGGASQKGPEAPPRWQLQGVFLGDDGRRRVLLQFEGGKQPPQFLRSHQALPNGWILQEIERFDVLVFDPATQEAVWMPWGDVGKPAL